MSIIPFVCYLFVILFLSYLLSHPLSFLLHSGSSVGVILPDSVDKDTRDLFEQILTQLTSYQEQAVPPGAEASVIQESTAERIAAGLVTGIIPFGRPQQNHCCPRHCCLKVGFEAVVFEEWQSFCV